jgi:hypothetical protein
LPETLYREALVEGRLHGSGHSPWGIILISHNKLALSDVQKHGDNASGLQSQQLGKSLNYHSKKKSIFLALLMLLLHALSLFFFTVIPRNSTFNPSDDSCSPIRRHYPKFVLKYKLKFPASLQLVVSKVIGHQL